MTIPPIPPDDPRYLGPLSCATIDLDAGLRASERAAGERPSPASQAPGYAAGMRRIHAGHQAHAETSSCPRCEQQLIGDATICDACRQLDRQPQGETFALFDPTPYSAHQPPAIRGQEEMF